MTSITIQPDFEGGPEFPSIHLTRGEQATFGRGKSTVPVDVPVAPHDLAVSRTAGVIRVGQGYWTISNTSRAKTYVVEHTDRAPGYVRIDPGRQGAPIAFETSWIRIPGSEREHRFLVLAPENAPVVLAKPSDGTVTGTSFRLDRNAAYFRVLAAICEPSLRSPSHTLPPTRKQIAERSGLGLAGVTGQIDYLVRHKFALHTPATTGQGIDWRLPALLELALRFNLVSADDLSLLDP
jgi:hypothetical protein